MLNLALLGRFAGAFPLALKCCAAFFEQRLLDHLSQNLTEDGVEIIKLSDDWAAIALQGPRSRDVLTACTDATPGSGLNKPPPTATVGEQSE